MLPVVSPPFVLSLSMIMLFGKAGVITRFLLGIYDNSVYGFWGIVIVQTLTFFPVCYMTLKGLVKLTDYNPKNKRIYQVGENCCLVFDSESVHIL